MEARLARLLPMLVGAIRIGNERAVRTVVDRLSEMEFDFSEDTELLISSIQVVGNLLLAERFSIAGLVSFACFFFSGRTSRHSQDLSA